MPHGVIGNTPVSGAGISGSSPDEAATVTSSPCLETQVALFLTLTVDDASSYVLSSKRKPDKKRIIT